MVDTTKIKKTARQVGSKLDHAAERAHKELAEATGEKTHELASNVQDHITGLFSSLRRAAHAGSNQLRQDGYAIPASLLEQASGRTYEAEDKVNSVNTAKIAHEVQGTIRTSPLLVFGALAVAGFVVVSAMQKNAPDE